MTATYFSIMPKDINSEILKYLSRITVLSIYGSVDPRIDEAIREYYIRKFQFKFPTEISNERFSLKRDISNFQMELKEYDRLYSRIRRFLFQGTIAEDMKPTRKQLHLDIKIAQNALALLDLLPQQNAWLSPTCARLS